MEDGSCFSEGVSASQVSEHLSEAPQTVGDFTVTSLPSVTEADFNAKVKLVIVVYGSVLLGGGGSITETTHPARNHLCVATF